MFRGGIAFTGLLVSLAGVSCSPAETGRPTDRASFAPAAIETVNINTATHEELMRVPFIGEKLADDILSFRESYGRFRRPEHLLLLDGFSDRRFREIRHLIRTE